MKRNKTMMPSKCWILYFVLIGVFLLNEGFLQLGEAQIVFSSNREGKFNLYMMEEDGGNLRQLTDFPDEASAPAWSPDGRKIAFNDKNGGLYVMNVDGNDPPMRVFQFWAFDPVWSPRGDQIAGTIPHPKRIGLWTLILVDVESGRWEEPTLQIMLGGMTRPAWSPDGRNIAVGPVVMDVQTLEVRQLFRDLFPSNLVWSPNGTQVAFGGGHIYIANADGTHLRQLTHHEVALDVLPVWSTDGKTIAFTSNRDRNWEIYVIDVDGQNLRNLTNHPADDRDPAWFPATGLAVAPSGKLATSWGALKQNAR